MLLSPANFSYQLSQSQIALKPTNPRDACKLLTLNRQTGEHQDLIFHQIKSLLSKNDVLVFNQSKVFPARLLGKKESGGKAEILLLRPIEDNVWEAIGKLNTKITQNIYFDQNLSAKIIDINPTNGLIKLAFNQSGENFYQTLDKIGHTPIPPYIDTFTPESQLRQDYQTVYAQEPGSAAAPTAGLHFTQNLLAALKTREVQLEYVTLHVGLGTFQNLRPANLETKKLHSENYNLDPETASRLNTAKSQGKRIVAVGTTTVRVLESCCNQDGILIPQNSSTDIFIYPPYQYKFVDSLITNFHLPESSLLMLVSAFCSSPNPGQKYSDFTNHNLGKAYQHAIANDYRFFSFGDAMWIY